MPILCTLSMGQALRQSPSALGWPHAFGNPVTLCRGACMLTMSGRGSAGMAAPVQPQQQSGVRPDAQRPLPQRQHAPLGAAKHRPLTTPWHSECPPPEASPHAGQKNAPWGPHKCPWASNLRLPAPSQKGLGGCVCQPPSPAAVPDSGPGCGQQGSPVREQPAAGRAPGQGGSAQPGCLPRCRLLTHNVIRPSPCSSSPCDQMSVAFR